ncbi:MAG: hypothetical protein NC342_01020 [Pseudoflavonifractor sp.]|nr:hypothetical protein [Alloprevotella sp.]MCM1116104.1 hypothetical protein [Pseudoflavonifractor sp.]
MTQDFIWYLIESNRVIDPVNDQLRAIQQNRLNIVEKLFGCHDFISLLFSSLKIQFKDPGMILDPLFPLDTKALNLVRRLADTHNVKLLELPAMLIHNNHTRRA